MTLALSPYFGEMLSVAAWTRHLGGLTRLEGFHSEGRSEFVRAASEPLPPAPPLAVPRVLAREEAPSYIDQAPKELKCFLSWMAFYMGESRVIARDLDLASALMFLTRADTEREYAVERQLSGGYSIISGESERLLATGDILIHTHKGGIALPSEIDLTGIEGRVELGGRPWSLIYSVPPDEHQLAFIHRVQPRSFEIHFWRDRLDRERDERRTSARYFQVRTNHEEELADDNFEISSLEVREHALSGRTMGTWTYEPETHPEQDVQEFWKEVLR